MSRWTPATSIDEAAGRRCGLFGLGFGLTVTPRSTAAVEAAGQAAFGAASSVVTVARMLGMAVGLADPDRLRLDDHRPAVGQVYATPDAYLAYIPENLRDRPLQATRSSSRRSRRGRRARPRRSWSACSSSPRS